MRPVPIPASAVSEAVRHDRFQLARQIPRHGITHLDRRGQFGSPLVQHVLQILPCVFSAGEKQSDLLARRS